MLGAVISSCKITGTYPVLPKASLLLSSLLLLLGFTNSHLLLGFTNSHLLLGFTNSHLTYHHQWWFIKAPRHLPLDSVLCVLSHLTLSPASWGRFYSSNLINKENRTHMKSDLAKITCPTGDWVSSVFKLDQICHIFELIIHIWFPSRLQSLALSALFSLHTCSIHSSCSHDSAYSQFGIFTDSKTKCIWMVISSKCIRFYPELIKFHTCLIIFFPSKDSMGDIMMKNPTSTLQNRSWLYHQRGSGNGV